MTSPTNSVRDNAALNRFELEIDGGVAFANYPKFLKAFQRGEVDTMVIVPKMAGWRSFTASADDGKAGEKRRALR